MQAFHEDLNGRQYINEVYKFSVDKMYDILFTESRFMKDFLDQRRFSGVSAGLSVCTPVCLQTCLSAVRSFSVRVMNPDLISLPLSADIVYHPWKKEAAGDQTRDIKYTISLTNPLAPKSATVTETQVSETAVCSHNLTIAIAPDCIYKCAKHFRIIDFTESGCERSPLWCQTLFKASQESECYIIDAEVIAHDVPYHDYFYTLNRYMLTRVAKNKCRLR